MWSVAGRELNSPFAFLMIACGFTWLYWLREIGEDVIQTLPEGERVRWRLSGIVPSKMHSIWRNHAALFPKSRKRMWAAVSLLLLFLIPIIAFLTRFLISDPFRIG
jgi:hypothetical protein